METAAFKQGGSNIKTISLNMQQHIYHLIESVFWWFVQPNLKIWTLKKKKMSYVESHLIERKGDYLKETSGN